jgi:hypothetical protein
MSRAARVDSDKQRAVEPMRATVKAGFFRSKDAHAIQQSAANSNVGNWNNLVGRKSRLLSRGICVYHDYAIRRWSADPRTGTGSTSVCEIPFGVRKGTIGPPTRATRTRTASAGG